MLNKLLGDLGSRRQILTAVNIPKQKNACCRNISLSYFGLFLLRDDSHLGSVIV